MTSPAVGEGMADLTEDVRGSSRDGRSKRRTMMPADVLEGEEDHDELVIRQQRERGGWWSRSRPTASHRRGLWAWGVARTRSHVSGQEMHDAVPA